MIFDIPQNGIGLIRPMFNNGSVSYYVVFLLQREILKSREIVGPSFHYSIPTQKYLFRQNLTIRQTRRPPTKLRSVFAFSSICVLSLFRDLVRSHSHDRPSLIRFYITSAPKPLLCFFYHNTFHKVNSPNHDYGTDHYRDRTCYFRRRIGDAGGLHVFLPIRAG